MTKKNFIHYTWKEFEQDCIKLAHEVPKTDWIVCVRGNRVGGSMLANMIGEITKNKNITSINYKYDETEGKKHVRNVVPNHPRLESKFILLCTEISNSGVMLRRALEDLVLHGNHVITVALHYRFGSVLIPHYYAKLVKSDVEYPWERVAKGLGK